MRALVLALFLVLAPMAGCLTGADDDPPGNPPKIPGGNEGNGGGGGTGGGGNGDDGQPRSSPTPSLAPGLAWTYQTDGLYSTQGDRTIVVAQASVDGYLFAGATPSDLVEEVHFNRSWLGPQTLELNPQGTDDDGPRLFDFPLTDGKTWPAYGGTVTATRTQVDTPAGTLPGYRMTLTGTDTNRTWTYAPGIGYLVTYTADRGGTTYLNMTLTGITTADNATWYQTLNNAAIAGNPANTAQISVSGNASTVSIAAGGADGGQVTVIPPLMSQQGPFSYQEEGEESWVYHRRPPAEGTWRVTLTQSPEGFAFASIAAVAWAEITPGYS